MSRSLTSWRRSPIARERPRASGPSSSWPRTSVRTCVVCARRRSQGLVSTPCGTTTFITRRRWRLPGHREAYYTDYLGSPQELISCAKRGFLYQGQLYSWQRGRRGTPTLGFSPERFVTFLDNHDQVANAPSGQGARVHQQTSPGLYRAITALWLLSPGTPMFFQGQEFAASSPFLYFADHGGDLGVAVRSGRAEFMSQFRSAATRPLVDDAARSARMEYVRAMQTRSC